MHSFSCVRVCFHSYALVLTCTGSFTVVHVCSSYSQWYVLVLIVLSCTHSFSVIIISLRIHSQWYTLIFSWTHSFLVIYTVVEGAGGDTHKGGRTSSVVLQDVH